MKIVALIPLRGWSVSIPRKNIKMLAGQPLCNYTIKAALWSHLINETRVSTEDQEIKKIALEAGAKVLDRPAEYATNTASTASVMIHFMEHIDFDILVTIQATSPLTTSEDLDNAIAQFLANNPDSMLTCVRTKRFFWNLDCTPLNYDFNNRPRRQDFNGIFMENWAFYITKREALATSKNPLCGKVDIYEMSEDNAVEIDSPEDWIAVEKIITKKQNSL